MRFLLLTALSFFVVATAHAAPSPAETISHFQETLLNNMKQGNALGCNGRIGNLKKNIPSTFDLPFLAQHIVRKHWAAQAAPQQQDFTFALEEMIVITYASQFAHFNGEKFVLQNTEDLGGERKVVHSQLVLPKNDPVNFDYVLRQTNGDWRIINVIANGVSDLAIRSAQYDRVIKDKGFGGLLIQLKGQNTKMKASCLQAAHS